MPALVLDGKKLSEAVRAKLKERVERLSPKLGRAPGLGVILVGENPASQVYVASKEKAARSCGIIPVDIRLPSSATQEQLEAAIRELNARADIDGILLQLPLPKGLDELRALSLIAVEKDADGLTPLNQGRLLRDATCFEPCTPKGVVQLIDHAREALGEGPDLSGLRALIIGRSVLVGKPVGVMLLKRNCTVTYAHSKTVALEEECRRADIIVAAVGRPEMIRAEWVSEKSIVIDVGINRTESGAIVGDVHYAGCRQVCRAITPVPGGVGPMTIAMLLENTVTSAESRL